jgi:hypothetical protein
MSVVAPLQVAIRVHAWTRCPTLPRGLRDRRQGGSKPGVASSLEGLLECGGRPDEFAVTVRMPINVTPMDKRWIWPIGLVTAG